MSELVLYTSNDGRTRLDLRIEGQTVWLTQLEIAELFQTTKQNVSLHAKNIFEDGELPPEAVAPPTQPTNVPVVKSEFDKTPRNAPCPCGSGKKFKMCHGRAA